MKLKSEFAILDVKVGRGPLTKRFALRPKFGPCPKDLRIPVVIKGFIDGVHSRDDGVSREFSIEVTSVETGEEK